MDTLIYPSDLNNVFMQFSFHPYKITAKPVLQNAASNEANKTPLEYKNAPVYNIRLYAPGGLQISSSANWADAPALASDAVRNISNSIEDLVTGKKDIFDIGNELKNITLSDITKEAAVLLDAAILNGISEKFTSSSGTGGKKTSTNINIDLHNAYTTSTGNRFITQQAKVYQGPQTATYNFNFEFHPTSEKESVEMMKILNIFRLASIQGLDQDSAVRNLPFGGLFKKIQSPPMVKALLVKNANKQYEGPITESSSIFNYPPLIIRNTNISFSNQTEYLAVFNNYVPTSAILSVQFETLYPMIDNEDNFFRILEELQ